MKLILGLLILAASSNAWCQAPVPREVLELRKSFEDKLIAEVNSLRKSITVPLERRYLDALKSDIKGVQQNGLLEETKFFQYEIEQVESFQVNPGIRLTEEVTNPTPIFGKLRSVYLGEIGKFESDVFRRISPKYKTQQQALKDLANRLTRQGQIEEAEAATQELKFVTLAACKISGGMIKILDDGQQCYSNRDYVWTEVSPNLKNLDFNMTAGGVSQSSVIEVLRPGLIYVACLSDDGKECMQQLQNLGFRKTSEYFLQKPRGGSGMSVFSKFVVQGFTLPVAAQSFSGFIVIGNLKT